MFRAGNRQVKTLLILVAAMIVVACLAMVLTAIGSGLALWLAVVPTQTVPAFTPKPTFTATPSTLPPTPTSEVHSTETPLPPTATPVNTAVATPTGTPTATPLPAPASPTPGLELPTATPAPASPTATPAPTFTSAPTYAFSVLETDQFQTGHESFDVYIAVTDCNNKPLGTYRVLATHSNGRQVESQESANEWTVNSGAMHYKAGNIKYEISDSSNGVWILQLLDAAGTEVAPPIDLAFDPMNPTWYFVLYQQTDGCGD